MKVEKLHQEVLTLSEEEATILRRFAHWYVHNLPHECPGILFPSKEIALFTEITEKL